MTKFLQTDPRTLRIERNIFSACRDPAALLNATLSDSTKSSAGLGVIGFRTWEETVVCGQKCAVPL
jgi:hypothetical protein